MNSMCKIQKILIGVFVCGVLLGGVGTGIAFVEYSSFAYGGEKKVGEEHLVTRQLDHIFDPARGRIAVDADWSWGEYGDCQILADPSVPEHVIRYEVTYNEKEVRPYLIYDESEEEPADIPDYIQGRIFLGVRHIGNDFATWMECKEDFLRELKQKRISYYERIGLAGVKIRVNPATLPYTKNSSE